MIDLELSNMEILQYAVSNGMIDTALLQEKIEMQKREEILKNINTIYGKAKTINGELTCRIKKKGGN